jgi:hypothetical protein
MKYVFLVAFQKGNKNLIKVRKIGTTTEVWATTSEAVCKYAKENLTKETEYEFQSEDKNGQIHISRVGNDTPAVNQPVSEPSQGGSVGGFKCSDCGAALKDGKYTKCYPCNKKNPAPKKSYSAPSAGGQRDAVGQSIEKQAMMKAAADAVATAMQGQVGDIDTLGDMIVKLYEKLLAKITT